MPGPDHPEGSIRRFYDGWGTYNQRLIDVIRPMPMDQLMLRPAPERPPIWATVGHTAGVRVYWLCGIFKEPGAETTPFPDPLAEAGWEDDEDHPRDADELVGALETTWAIVEGCLDRWTPEMLGEGFTRERAGKQQVHTRQSVIMRLISHEAYHCGELSQTLGILGLPQIDLWAPADPAAPEITDP
jgi:uncharacterized damage-inducible protein DinB